MPRSRLVDEHGPQPHLTGLARAARDGQGYIEVAEDPFQRIVGGRAKGVAMRARALQHVGCQQTKSHQRGGTARQFAGIQRGDHRLGRCGEYGAECRQPAKRQHRVVAGAWACASRDNRKRNAPSRPKVPTASSTSRNGSAMVS